MYGADPARGAYPLLIVSYALTCADDDTARDFVRTSLTMAGTAYVVPSDEWADRVAAALQ